MFLNFPTNVDIHRSFDLHFCKRYKCARFGSYEGLDWRGRFFSGNGGQRSYFSTLRGRQIVLRTVDERKKIGLVS